MESEGNQSVAAWSINVGSKLAQGVSKLYSNFFSTGSSSSVSTSGGSAGGAQVKKAASERNDVGSTLELNKTDYTH